MFLIETTVDSFTEFLSLLKYCNTTDLVTDMVTGPIAKECPGRPDRAQKTKQGPSDNFGGWKHALAHFYLLNIEVTSVLLHWPDYTSDKNLHFLINASHTQEWRLMLP